jgi:crotonobetaine/carnitine-CoA ligase
VPVTDVPRDVCAAPETIVDVLARRANVEPGARLVTFPEWGSVTVGEWSTLLEDCAGALLSAGGRLRPGDGVLTCIRPGPALLSVVGGVARAGLVEAPLTLDAPIASALAVIKAGGARVAVLGTAAVAANPDLRDLVGHVHVITVDDGAADGIPRSVRLEELRADRRGRLPRPPSPGDPALVMSTSGTTGRPKGVLLPHFAGVRHARRVALSMAYGPRDVLYNAFPWNHINIRHTGLLAALVSGARLVAIPRFSASSFWDTCRAEGVTAFNFMGAVAAILLRNAPSDGDLRHRVTRAYGGPAPTWLAQSFRDRFGVQLIEAYACTELGDVASNTVDDVVTGTAGHPLPEYQVRILDETGNPVGSGDVGRIAVRPLAPHISALGYMGSVRADARPDGWFDTGDRGRLDEGGRLVFAGRHSDVVRRRGENISTRDVEAVVERLPGVREAAAVGVCSEFTEEDLLLAVAPESRNALSADVVHDWCRHHLPRHAWPRFVVLLDELPRNSSTKVDKGALRADDVVRSASDFEEGRPPAGLPGAGPRPGDARPPALRWRGEPPDPARPGSSTGRSRPRREERM